MASKRFRILAQSFTTSRRITKTIEAATPNDALRLVWAELEVAGFYPIDAREV